MRIGIDIDGVLTDVERWQLDYGSKFAFNNNINSISKYNEYEMSDIFNWTKEQDDIFWIKYFENYSKNVLVRPFASEVINELKSKKYEIYIITARGSFLSNHSFMNKEDSNSIVIDWLNKNKIFYDKLIFSEEDKLSVCNKNKIDIMIEDKPQNIENISKKIPVICFHAEYNRNCIGHNIIRCYSWYDILDKILSQFLLDNED